LRKQKFQADLDDTLPDPHPGLETLVEEHGELEMVQRFLQAMPEIDRTAFILRVQHDLPYTEIARVLQLSVSAAKVKVHRTRKKLLMVRLSKELV
jgi:RNA polymerase sigma factor (sigma-70 family)